MIMKYLVISVVTGSGHFPIDMLRYDECFPSSNDAIDAMDAEGNRSVEISRYVAAKDGGLTVGRWNSFGWKVERQRVIKL